MIYLKCTILQPKFKKNANADKGKGLPSELLSPNSPLITMNIKDFINKDSFDRLPPKYQYDLLKRLPPCDAQRNADSSLRYFPGHSHLLVIR